MNNHFRGSNRLETPFPESATVNTRGNPDGDSPPTRGTVCRAQTVAGPGVPSDPTSARHSMTSRYPAPHPSGRTMTSPDDGGANGGSTSTATDDVSDRTIRHA